MNKENGRAKIKQRHKASPLSMQAMMPGKIKYFRSLYLNHQIPGQEVQVGA